jgi:hypothetical protein
MVLLDFRPFKKNSLRGFADVELTNKLTVFDCPVMCTNGRAWATLPSRPVLDRDGRHVEESGRRKYVPILSWPDRATADCWSAAVVELVRQRYPHAFDDGGAP